MEGNYSIRYMVEADIDDVLIVENNSFATPWSRTAFVNEIRNNKFAHYLVVEDNGKIIGYCGVWVIVDEAHITNIAIHPLYRGQKLGEQLLVHGIELARTLGATKMTLEVRVSNHIAQRLYSKLGFQPGGIRKNYYTDNQENALVMWVGL
ncbi:ribosomal protein S18-alanine N-acetyltransferase [Anaerobacillus sp. CMMVII]|uniref:ribosomal protein S18-alanine N-acetyltransferase n=1 Tax=Anaerobacillus sp. CMMVII TaxID=2755588 RepID=UPI0021B739B5|nr:ribosomal protein S18-alanine N-acetyltransferase [Anaerobacillus sp. CMMVII]MCT8136586.1 ribosomal protein S18-alanine N-acetyltransferase [Anaerobacillus sp. CMMVII]